MKFRCRLSRLVAVLAPVVCLATAFADEKVWQLHIDQGRKYQEAGRYQEALGEFEQAHVALRNDKPDLLCEALSVNFKGMALLHLGETADAERTFREAARLFEQVQGPQSLQLAMVLGNLGDTYLVRGQPAQAQRSLDRAIAILDATQPADAPLRGPMLQTLGRLAMLRHDYGAAQELLDKARVLLEKQLGPRDRFVIQVREDMMELARLQGDAPREVRIAEATVRDYEAAVGPQHPEVANAYSNLAVAYKDASRIADARRAIQHAVEVAESVFPANHPMYAGILNNYVQLMKGTQEGSQLKRLSAKAKAILAEHARRNASWTVDAGDAAYQPRR